MSSWSWQSFVYKRASRSCYLYLTHKTQKTNAAYTQCELSICLCVWGVGRDGRRRLLLQFFTLFFSTFAYFFFFRFCPPCLPRGVVRRLKVMSLPLWGTCCVGSRALLKPNWSSIAQQWRSDRDGQLLLSHECNREGTSIFYLPPTVSINIFQV